MKKVYITVEIDADQNAAWRADEIRRTLRTLLADWYNRRVVLSIGKITVDEEPF